MKYLIWYNEVRALATSQNLQKWESFGGRRDYFHNNLTPGQALEKQNTPLFRL